MPQLPAAGVTGPQQHSLHPEAGPAQVLGHAELQAGVHEQLRATHPDRGARNGLPVRADQSEQDSSVQPDGRPCLRIRRRLPQAAQQQNAAQDPSGSLGQVGARWQN